MKKILKNVIASGSYKLADMQYKIKKLYALGDLSEEEADELLSLASGGVSTDAERPELLQIVRKLSDRVDALAAEVAALKPGAGTDVDGYEPWTAWDGISDKYHPGTIVTHNGKTWISNYPGQNVWEPGVVGTTFWAEYQEDQYDDQVESGLLEEG